MRSGYTSATPTDQSHVDEPILTVPWHPSVDPTTVPFATRTRNILQRLGLLHDPELLAQLTARELLEAESSGPVTVQDFTTTVHALRGHRRRPSRDPPGGAGPGGGAAPRPSHHQVPCEDHRL